MNFYNQLELFTQKDIQVKIFDLPDSDITLYENLFTIEESNRLYESLFNTIKWQQDQSYFYGKKRKIPRLTAWYGNLKNDYSYSGIIMKPHPWNTDLLFIKQKIEKITKVEFTNCLLNKYRTGQDSVGWHQDNEKELGHNPIIGSVSFGETRPFQLKHLNRTDIKKVDVFLTHGSFLLMKGSTQHFWEHQIPKTSQYIKPRINLTFRMIK